MHEEELRVLLKGIGVFRASDELRSQAREMIITITNMLATNDIAGGGLPAPAVKPAEWMTLLRSRGQST